MPAVHMSTFHTRSGKQDQEMEKFTQGTETLLSSPSWPEDPLFQSRAPESQAVSTSDGFTPWPALPGRIKLISTLKSWFMNASQRVLGSTVPAPVCC